MDTDLEKITPPTDSSPAQRSLIFQLFCRRLASYRNTLLIYAAMECSMSDDNAISRQRDVEKDVNNWAQALLAKAWIVCFDREEERTSHTDSFALQH